MEKIKVVDSDNTYAKMLAQKTNAMLKQVENGVFSNKHTLYQQSELLAKAVGCVNSVDKETLRNWMEKRAHMANRD